MLTNLSCFIGSYQNLSVLKMRLAEANVIKRKLPMFVIGKAKLRKCFKRIKYLPFWHRSQKKDWRNGFVKLIDNL